MTLTMTILEEVVASSVRLRAKTRTIYLARVRDFLDHAGRHPASWTLAAVEGWRAALLSRGVAPNSVNQYIAAIKFASRRYAQHGGQDFASAVERVPQDESERAPPLTLAQVRALLATCRGPSAPDLRDRAMILCGIHCGLRRAELCNITFDALRGGTVSFVAKGGAHRTIPVAPPAWKALSAWQRWLRARGVADGPVFRSLRPTIDAGDGREGWTIGDAALTADGFAKSLAARGEAAGLPLRLSPHMLRSTCASLLIANGAPPWRVRALLGHKTDAMTSRYMHDQDPEAVSVVLPPLDEEED